MNAMEMTAPSGPVEESPKIRISLPRYTFWLFLFRVTIPVMTTLVFFTTGISLSPYKYGISLWPAVLAALIVGRRFARTSGRTIEPKEARSFALSATLRFIIVDILVALGMTVALGRPQLLLEVIDMTGDQALVLVGFLIPPLLAAYFMNRWCVVLAATASHKLRKKSRKQKV